MILYVLRYWPTRTETFAHAEIRALPGVELATFGAREGSEALGDVPIHRAPHRWGWLAALPVVLAEWLRRPDRVGARVLWLTGVVRRARRVHVHFAGEAAEWTRQACARAGVPYSVTVHAVDLWRPHPAFARILADATCVVTVTEANRAELRRRGVEAVLVRCGVDVDPVGGGPSAEGGDGEAGAVVLAVARAVPKKGLDLVVEAARRLPDTPFVIVSDLPDPGLPNVRVTGLLPHEDVLAWIRRARVLVSPNRVAPDGDRDGLPVVLLEALAAGVPVITTAVAGIPEVVDEAVGWIVPGDDVDAIVAALGADPAEARRRGARGPGRVRERGCRTADQIDTMARILGAGRVGGAGGTG